MFGSDVTVNQLLSHEVSTDWQQFPGLPFAANIEASFNRDYHRQWMYENWSIALYVCTAYVVGVLFGQHIMSMSAKKYSLRVPLFAWNAILAIFSILGTIRCLPEFVSVIWNSGLESSYCSSSYYYDVRLTFWYWVFVWSKVVELGDTAFIILRKQPLIALHWIHHVLTLTYAFFVIGEAPASARWMVNMNFAIHSLMYTYYALKSLRISVSRSIAMIITSAQIVQMVFGLYINAQAFRLKWSAKACDTSLSASGAGLFIYALFFCLFINFFMKSYGKKLTKVVAITSNSVKSGLKSVWRWLSGAARNVANKVD
ncbi:elongation of very long chain fatty acids protein 6-like [Oppia nitens]|uniref:elongation of very long chain fatty acids protein 6-like n=1 Tax=Oppia nitens TaxID=1686743 RepID=UPI0023DB3686|nr:elongation of very long chain fatty acids protein 6-like [Oppia nitens]